MAESNERRPPLVLVILLAMLGVYALPKGGSSEPKPSPPEPAKASAKTSAQRTTLPLKGDQLQTLEPLIAFYDNGDGSSPSDIAELMVNIHSSNVKTVHCLIATIPSLTHSTNSYRFDDYLDAMARAIETQGFVQDRFRIPWDESSPGGDQAVAQAITGLVPWAKEEQPAQNCGPQHQPGLIVFRHVSAVTGTGESAKLPPDQLLLLFLVPETPTQGVDKQAMRLSLDLCEMIGKELGGQLSPVRLLGPHFSGSQKSVEVVLSEWLQAGDRSKYDVRIIAGCVTAVDVARIERLRCHSVTFHSALHRSSTTVIALKKYVRELVGENEPIAILQESNTGLGQQYQERQPKEHPAVHDHIYPFPLHVAELRSSYARSGLLSDRGTQAVRSAAKLPLPLDESGASRDVIESKTPEISAAIDELELDQTLADLKQRQFKAIGILATDSRDVVFLVDQIRQFCPNALIFTAQADMLFTHPQNIGSMRGVLVGSTYPLYARNQSWSYPFKQDINLDAKHVFFSGHGTQGVYNAMLAHLSDMKVSPECQTHEYLEYGPPFSKGPTAGSFRPPVWISVVGQRGMYPIRADSRPEDDDYLYPLKASAGPCAVPEPKFDRLSWNEAQWWFLIVSLTMLCGLLLAVAYLHAYWAVGFAEHSKSHSQPQAQPKRRGRSQQQNQVRRSQFFPHALAEFLTWEKSKTSVAEGIPRGPGVFLTLAVGLVLLVYFVVAAPLLGMLPDWLGVEWRNWLMLFLSGIVLLTITAMIAAIVVCLGISILFIVEQRQAPKAAGKKRNNNNPGHAVGAQGGDSAAGSEIVSSPISVHLSEESRLRTFVQLWLVGLAVGLCVVVVTCALLLRSGSDRVSNRLAFERASAATAGVSPTVPALFIGAACVAWIYCQLKRRYILEQHTLKIDETNAPPKPKDPTVDATTVLDIRHHCIQFQKALFVPLRIFTRVDWSYRVGLVVLLGIFAWQSWKSQANTPDGVFFSKAMWLLTSLLFILLAFHAFQVIVLWTELQTVLKLVARMSLIHAIERMPYRVSRWFFQSPTSNDDRFDMVRRQSDALRRQCTDEVKAELDKEYPGAIGEADWDELKTALDQVYSSGERYVMAVRNKLLPALFLYWKGRPIADTFGRAGNEEAAGASDSRRGVPGASGPPQQPAQNKDALADWFQAAEDFFAVQLMRWLGPSLNQIWTIIGFLVFGSVCLTLAVTSYTFPMRGTLFAGLRLLALVLAAVVLLVLIGTRRDELISRIASAGLKKLNFDSSLVSGLLTYILPLLGLVAALSVDTSDMIHTLLDPILRAVS